MPRTQEPTVVAGGTIYETTDYRQFHFMVSNRDQNRGHIEALKRAFIEIGNLTSRQPILVNENMDIIDGQHRFVAARELDMPICYTIQPGLGVTDARHMNILHRNWTTDDYAASYATTDPNYQHYLELREDYGFNHSITVAYILGNSDRGIFGGFRHGNFTIPDLDAAKTRLNNLLATTELLPVIGKNREFAYAYLKVMQVPRFDQERMLRKIEQVGEQIIRRYGSVVEFQRALEDTYNYGMSETNRLRLY